MHCLIVFVSRTSVFSVALRCDKTLEGQVDPVTASISKNTYVSSQCSMIFQNDSHSISMTVCLFVCSFVYFL